MSDDENYIVCPECGSKNHVIHDMNWSDDSVKITTACYNFDDCYVDEFSVSYEKVGKTDETGKEQ